MVDAFEGATVVVAPSSEVLMCARLNRLERRSFASEASSWRLAATVGLGVALVAVLGARAADAAEPRPRDERPETRDLSLQELRAIGLGQYRGDPRPVPPEYPRRNLGAPGTALEGPGEPEPWIIFVNFDGEMLTPGMDSAQQNITQIFELAGAFAPYGDGPQRQAVLQAVMADWAAYNMEVVDERPASGEYVMNMTGPTNPFGGGVLGIAPVDCSNLQTHSNITFAFHSADDGFSAAITATTVGQEVAHSFGLEHVDEPNDIMNPYNAGGDPTFIDQCIPIVGGAVCPQQHMQHCPDALAQNAHQELLTMFGPAVVDTDPPVVLITAPLHGQEFDAGSDFSVIVDVTDDSPVTSVELLHNGAPVMIDTSEPWGFGITNVPAGTHLLEATAVDENGNVGNSAPVEITVLEIGGTEGDTDTDGAGQDEDAGGCGCRQAGVGSSAPWGLVLLALGLRRRRR